MSSRCVPCRLAACIRWCCLAWVPAVGLAGPCARPVCPHRLPSLRLQTRRRRSERRASYSAPAASSSARSAQRRPSSSPGHTPCERRCCRRSGQLFCAPPMASPALAVPFSCHATAAEACTHTPAASSCRLTSQRPGGRQQRGRRWGAPGGPRSQAVAGHARCLCRQAAAGGAQVGRQSGRGEAQARTQAGGSIRLGCEGGRGRRCWAGLRCILTEGAASPHLQRLPPGVL